MSFTDRFDHVSVAVREVQKAAFVFRDILGGEPVGGMEIPWEGFRFTQYRYPNRMKIELMEPLGQGGRRARFLSRHLHADVQMSARVPRKRVTLGRLAGGTWAAAATVMRAQTMVLLADQIEPQPMARQIAFGLRLWLARKRLAAVWLFATAAVFAACGNAPGEPDCSYSSATLSFTSQPTDVDTGSLFTPPIEVTAQDHASGRTRTLTCFNGSVSVSLHPQGISLTGTTTVRAIKGVATFPDLKIDTAGQYYNYMLEVVAPELTGTAYGSYHFNVIACAHDCWLRRAPMPTPRANMGIGVVNGVLYAIGGFDGPLHDTVEAYSPVTGRWTTRAPMLTARSEFGVGVVNGVIYAVGGYDAVNQYVGTRNVEAYDPITNHWTTRAAMPTARVGLGVGVVNGVLYAVGGITGGFFQKVVLPTVEAYDPTLDRWTAKASMPTARAYLGVGVLNGILYAVGGESDTTVEAYDPVTDRWTARTPLAPAGFQVGVGVVADVLYAVPGVRGSGPFITKDLIVAYDPVLNIWSDKSPPPWYSYGRFAAGIGVVDSALYEVGGFSDWVGDFLSDNVEYRP